MKKINVKIVCADNYSFEELKHLKYITDEDVEKADRYIKDDGKITHLISSYFKRKYVKSYYISEYGKPLSDDMYFNISHNGYSIIFASNDTPIGVDIEKIQKVDDKLKRYISSDEEYEYIKDDKAFYEIWTSKESLVKACGEGFNERACHVPALPIDGPKIFKEHKYYSKHILYNGYVISVTCEGNKDFDIVIKNEFFLYN